GRSHRRRGPCDGEPRRRPAHRPAPARVPRPPRRPEGARRQRRSRDSPVLPLPRRRSRTFRVLWRARRRAGRLRGERRDLPVVHRGPPSTFHLGVSHRRDLLGSDVLGVLRAQLARLGAFARHRGALAREKARRGAARARTGQTPDALLDDRSRRAGRRFLAPAAERPGRAGRFGPGERDGGGPSWRVSCRGPGAGGLLGAFLLALWARKARQADALAAIGASAVFMLFLWLGSKGWVPFALGRKIAWPWYSLLGSTITFSLGWVLSQRHAVEDPRLTLRA